MSVELSVEGLREVQIANEMAIRAMAPAGGLGRAVKHIVQGLHEYAKGATHVDTGAWQASHRMTVDGLAGRVFLADSTNPRTKEKVKTYASIWEAQGGDLAAYKQTYHEAGPRLLEQAGDMIIEALP